MAKSIPRRALLIGCDYYFQGNARVVDGNEVIFSNLSGCVEDVNAVQEFLECFGVPRNNIYMLKASCDVRSPLKPLEDNSIWPTYDNIIATLDHIAAEFQQDFAEDDTVHYENKVKPDSAIGGLLYIHYSGHGIRRDALPTDKKSAGGDNLVGTALAMTDVSIGGPYLTGHQLGARIQGMVFGLKRRLRVTLILDSCFSGGGFRAPGLRTISMVDTTVLEKDRIADADADRYLASLRGSRQAKVRESWLSNPVGCTVLTACDVNQMADENWFQQREIGEKTKRGVLSWWMLDLLSQHQQSRLPTHAAVRDHVKRHLGSKGQDPILHGDGNYEFFGDKEYVERPACLVSNVSGDKLRLHVGSAQGVAVGAIYDIYPPGCNIEHGKNFSLAHQARVTAAYPFYSVAQLDGINPGNTDRTVADGSRAVLRLWALQEPVSVLLMLEDVYLKNWLKTEMIRTPNLSLYEGCFDEQTLTITTDGKSFEISEYGVRLERLPDICIDDELAAPKLAYVLRHISRYRDIKEIWDRPRSCTVREYDFDVRPANESQRPENIDGLRRFTIVENEILPLRFIYTGPLGSVWVQVYELNPSWGIEKKFERQMFRNLLEPPDPIEISTEIPPKGRENDADSTTDRYMIFICDGRDKISWDEILLPSLPVGKLPLQMDFGVDFPHVYPGGKRSRWKENDPGPVWGLEIVEICTLPSGSRI